MMGGSNVYNSPTIVIDFLGGNCPVQAEGTVDGQPFYFRARGDHWSMSIGGSDVVGKPDWYYDEPYETWPDAGWMSIKEAEAFLHRAASAWVSRILAGPLPAPEETGNG